jgi:hypothetical protein
MHRRFWFWANRVAIAWTLLSAAYIVYGNWGHIYIVLTYLSFVLGIGGAYLLFGMSGVYWQQAANNPHRIVDGVHFLDLCLLYPQLLMYGVVYIVAHYVSSQPDIDFPRMRFWTVLALGWVTETQFVFVIIWLMRVYWESQIRLAILWGRPGLQPGTDMDILRRDFITHGPISEHLRTFGMLWLVSPNDYRVIHGREAFPFPPRRRM